MNYQKCMTYISITIAFTFIAMSANAYNYLRWNGNILSWNQNSADVEVSTNSYPNMIITNLQNVLNQELNNNPSNFTLNLQSSSNVSNANQENETWFSSSLGPPAQARYWYFTGSNPRLFEVDVVFDIRVNWTTAQLKRLMSAYGGTQRPWQTGAVHEFGHFFGLAHEPDKYNSMGQDWDHIHTNGEDSQAYFGEDASEGAVNLYGSNSNRGEDVGVVHWRRTGSSGSYSTHNRTRVFDTTGNRLSRIRNNGEPHYLVDNGQTIEVEFSYENNGVNMQSVNVGFYLSDNDIITTFDQQLKREVMDLYPNDVWTKREAVTLPNDLDPNTTYWIGAIVDDGDNLTEWKEDNNATYIGLRTRNFTPPPTPTVTPTPTPISISTPTEGPVIPTPEPTLPEPTIGPTPIPTPIRALGFAGNLAELELSPQLPFDGQWELGESYISSELPMDNAFEDATDGEGLVFEVGAGQAVTLMTSQVPISGDYPILIRVNARSSGPGSDIALAAAAMDGSTVTNIPSDSELFAGAWRRLLMVFNPPGDNVFPILQAASRSDQRVTVYFDNLEIFELRPGTCIPTELFSFDEMSP